MSARARQRKTWVLIFTASAAVLLAAIGACAAVSLVAVRDAAYRQTESNLRQFCYATAHLLERQPGFPESAALRKFSESFSREPEFRLTLVDADGTVLADSSANPALLSNHLNRPEVAAAANEAESSVTRYSDSLDKRMVYYAIPFQGRVLRLAVAADYVDVASRRIAALLVVATVWILLATLAVSSFVASRLTVPLKLLGSAAGAGPGDIPAVNADDPRFPREYADLARTLGEMSARLRDQLRALDARNRETDAILAGMNDALIMVDSSRTLLRANPAAERLFGLKAGEYSGKSLIEVVRNTDIADFAANPGTGESERTVEIRGASPDGTRYLLVKASPIAESSAQLLVFSDITRLTRLERIRRDFVANVSHELKTPVTSIRGFIETLKDGAIDDPEAAKNFLSILEQQSLRLGAIIDDLLTISRLEQDSTAAIPREETRIAGLLADVDGLCRDAASKKGTAIRYDCPPDLTCSVNPGLIEQALTNLVQNAIRYSPEGSAVSVEARIAGEGEQRRLVCTVSDNGIGIPEKHLGRIFERFYRVDKGRSRESGGTGLGLSIVRHIALAHGGTVSVSSVEGKGSAFTIDIPA